MKTKSLIVVVLSVFLNNLNTVNAQFNNSAFISNSSDSLKANHLYLDINNFNFVRNYEYFNAFQDGYTLFGSILEPQLKYIANDNLQISVGAFLRKDFGDRGLNDAKPLFNVKYHKNNLKLIFGSIEGNVQHQYIEPLYDLERRITNPVEYGTQLKIDKPNYHLIAWISWDKMIYKNSTEQEQISGGLTSDFNIIKKDQFKLSLPLQFMVKHKGGQIDIKPSQPLVTMVNAAIGLKLELPLTNNKTFSRVFTENYWVGYKDMSPQPVQIFEKGKGYWLNLGLDSKYGTIITSYWNGNNFFSLKGTPIYQSISSDIDFPNYAESKRSLLLIRYAYQQALLPNLFFDVRIEPIFDLHSPKSKKMDFSNSFFLTYRETIKLTKDKK